ncbi:MAG: cysteine desulfurase-like protein [Thermoanaerobaculia bacterium]|nr:cysteine desulfurase-like protein [Thermoanaerobaculia bacterium]
MSTRSISSCRSDFPALQRSHQGRPLAYLDGPAGSQVPQVVIDAVSEVYLGKNSNTHGSFPVGHDTDRLMESAREKVAAFLGAASGDTISFGPSMTGLAFSLSRALARGWSAGDEVVITALDHEANRAPWLRLADEGIVVREVAIRPDGSLDTEDLATKVGPRTRLLAIGAASNAMGWVNDLVLARRLTDAVGARLLVDAVHSAPHFSLDVEGLDLDFLLCSAYKFYGPHVGILYCRPGLLDQLDTDRLRTQSQEAPHRCELGTQNHAAINGVAAAIDYLASWGEGETLRMRLMSALSSIGRQEREVASQYYRAVQEIPGVRIWGPDFSSSHRAPTVSLTLDGMPAADLAARLGDMGIQVWSGHFYAIRAIEALGLEGQGGLLRAGFLMYNTEEEAERLSQAISDLATTAR